jgi:hypothetical protein
MNDINNVFVLAMLCIHRCTDVIVEISVVVVVAAAVPVPLVVSVPTFSIPLSVLLWILLHYYIQLDRMAYCERDKNGNFAPGEIDVCPPFVISSSSSSSFPFNQINNIHLQYRFKS